MKKLALACLLSGFAAPLIAADNSNALDIAALESSTDTMSDESLSADHALPRYICVARSGFHGPSFRGSSHIKLFAEREALRDCRRHSGWPHGCQIVYCRKVGGWLD